jgi:hypothetical protein
LPALIFVVRGELPALRYTPADALPAETTQVTNVSVAYGADNVIGTFTDCANGDSASPSETDTTPIDTTAEPDAPTNAATTTETNATINNRHPRGGRPELTSNPTPITYPPKHDPRPGRNPRNHKTQHPAPLTS